MKRTGGRHLHEWFFRMFDPIIGACWLTVLYAPPALFERNQLSPIYIYSAQSWAEITWMVGFVLQLYRPPLTVSKLERRQKIGWNPRDFSVWPLKRSVRPARVNKREELRSDWSEFLRVEEDYSTWTNQMTIIDLEIIRSNVGNV